MSMSNECCDGCGYTLSFTINWDAAGYCDQDSGTSGSCGGYVSVDNCGEVTLWLDGFTDSVGGGLYAEVYGSGAPVGFDDDAPCFGIGLAVSGVGYDDTSVGFIVGLDNCDGVC
jgi:hypothetical protein